MRLWDVIRLPRPWFAQVDGGTLKADAVAGLTNAAVVLPQGLAFAIIAGLPPHYGLFTAMITPIVAAIWGSSMVMVSGPTTAISAILFATLSAHAPPGTPDYVTLALALTIMVGLFQIAAGLLQLGGLISFISHSVMVGFTAAAAVLISASQLGAALGMDHEQGGDVVERLLRVVEHRDDIHWRSAAIATATILCIVVLQRIGKAIPAYLAALFAGSALGVALGADSAGIAMFAPLDVVTPSLHLPTVPPQALLEILPAAAIIAFVALLEAISIGRTFAIRRDEAFSSSPEFVGQGLSNVVGGMFQCYAGSGSFTRSGLNDESGARTPLSAILAAGFLFLMLLALAPLARFIPVPVIAAIILVVAVKLIKPVELRHILTSGRDEILIFSLTFAAAIFIELEAGILVGVLTSLCTFLHRSARPHVACMAPVLTGGRRHMRGVLHYKLEQCPDIMFLRIEGPLFFASTDHVEAEFRRFEATFPGRRIRILALKGLGGIDLSAADLLIREIRRARADGGDFLIVAAHVGLVRSLRALHVIDALGADKLLPTKTLAVAAAVAAAPNEVCRRCTSRIFLECAQKPTPDGVPPTREPKTVQDVYENF